MAFKLQEWIDFSEETYIDIHSATFEPYVFKGPKKKPKPTVVKDIASNFSSQKENRNIVFNNTVASMKDFDYSVIDERMVEIVKDFNTIEGVVSRFCCSGHSLDEIREAAAKDGLELNSSTIYAYAKPAHLIFTYDDDFNLNDLLKVFTQWKGQLSNELQEFLRPSLSFFSLMDRDLYNQKNFWYEAVEIELAFYYNKPEESIEKTNDAWLSLINALKKQFNKDN